MNTTYTSSQSNDSLATPLTHVEIERLAQNVTPGQLRSVVERIERLEEEKAALAADIRDIYAEAKANGFDPKVLRQVIKIRKMDANERDEQEAVLDTYLSALGMG